MHRNIHVSVIYTLILYCKLTSSETVEWKNEALKSAEKLGDNVDEILDDLLGYKNFQDYYNTLSFSERELDGSDILVKMANNFGKKFFDRNNVVKSLKKVVEDSLTLTSHLEECCTLNPSNMEMNDRFKQLIGQGGCQRISKTAERTFGFLSKKFEDACVENLGQMPFLAWQYFASESGITSLYPGIEVEDCGSYDARYRPFYVQTNVPDSKDIVIVIDKSGSMGKIDNSGVKLMDIAKEAAKTVVSTLNPHDRVAVIGFSDSIVAMGSNNPIESCFGEELARATNENIQTINQFISEIRHGGTTSYALALSKAFDFFDGTPIKNKRAERVILFLSDGKPTDKPTELASGRYIFTDLKERNKNLNNSVILMTYGLGDDDFDILRAMASQNGTQYGIEGDSAEAIKVGSFTLVKDPTNLRQEMASYYRFFSKRTTQTTLDKEIWSLPYKDAWGMGLLMSVSLPVHDASDNIVGVVATDLTLDDLLSGAVYFRPSELSYIFIIDSYGYVLYHPLFKYPDDGEVKYIDIQAFETDKSMADVIDDMKSGGSGSKTFFAQRISPGGSNKLYGIKTFSTTTEAYWKQIPHTDFSLCVILAKGDVESTLQTVQPRNGDDFLYHRLDIVPSENPCKHYNNYCAMNQSAVSLGPRGFIDTDAYLMSKETVDGIKSIKNYMITGRGGSLITNGVRNAVWATQEAERFWKEHQENELEKYVMWKYVATNGGMIRMYPGSQFPKDFDPAVRPWYQNSMSNKGKNTFTLPYKDAVSGQLIFTLTKVVYEAKPVGERNYLKDEVVAVMGVDILDSAFQTMIKGTFPLCFESDDYRCILIDSGGFVMYGESVNYETVLPEHITQKEPLVAESLVENGIMAHTDCMVIESTTVQKTYRIQREENFAGEASGNCFKYEFIPIPRTNVYMVVRQVQSSCRPSQSSCVCSDFFSKDQTRGCVSNTQTCECPCTKLYEAFNTCTNKFESSGTDTVPRACTPSPRKLMELGTNEYNIGHLPQCTKYSVNNDDPPKPGGEGAGIGAIVGGCVAAIIVLIIIIVLVYQFVYKKNKSANRRHSESIRNEPLPPPPVANGDHETYVHPMVFPLSPSAPPAPPEESHYANVTPFGKV
ncbi:VWFA and cache domain-containing protein 1-like isoform X1 [Styela clava]